MIHSPSGAVYKNDSIIYYFIDMMQEEIVMIFIDFSDGETKERKTDPCDGIGSLRKRKMLQGQQWKHRWRLLDQRYRTASAATATTHETTPK